MSALADSTTLSYVYGQSGLDTDSVAGVTSRVLTSPDGQVLNLTDSNGDSAAFIVDGLGNQVGALADIGTGSDAATVAWDPYGTATVTSGMNGPFRTQDPFDFKVGGRTSQYQNGIIRYGLRWYLPTTGTWTQEDTLDAPLDLNNADRYAFSGDDPTDGSDPAGRAYESISTTAWLDCCANVGVDVSNSRFAIKGGLGVVEGMYGEASRTRASPRLNRGGRANSPQVMRVSVVASPTVMVRSAMARAARILSAEVAR